MDSLNNTNTNSDSQLENYKDDLKVHLLLLIYMSFFLKSLF